jgi:hypothetical protein
MYEMFDGKGDDGWKDVDDVLQFVVVVVPRSRWGSEVVRWLVVAAKYTR